MKSIFWLVLLLVLGALGIAPVAFGVWLAARLETWTSTHLACLVPAHEALRAQARAAGMFLRRVWSAVAESRRALAQLKPEDPPQNLYRLSPAPEFADGPIDVHEIARVVGLSAERFEEHFEALAGRPSDPADEDAAPDLAAETLAEYEERFTRRILYHSVIEYRLHAFALGVDVDRRAFSHD